MFSEYCTSSSVKLGPLGSLPCSSDLAVRCNRSVRPTDQAVQLQYDLRSLSTMVVKLPLLVPTSLFQPDSNLNEVLLILTFRTTLRLRYVHISLVTTHPKSLAELATFRYRIARPCLFIVVLDALWS